MPHSTPATALCHWMEKPLAFRIHRGRGHSPYFLNLSLPTAFSLGALSRTVTVTLVPPGFSVNVIWYRVPQSGDTTKAESTSGGLSHCTPYAQFILVVPLAASLWLPFLPLNGDWLHWVVVQRCQLNNKLCSCTSVMLDFSTWVGNGDQVGL